MERQHGAEHQAKHQVSFQCAQAAFAVPHRVIANDLAHSEAEGRFSNAHPSNHIGDGWFAGVE